VHWADERRVYEYIREMILDKMLKIDLPEMFNVRTPLILTLAEIFLSEPGTILNINSLASSLKVNKLLLEQHIQFLEFAKIIRIIKNFRPSIRAESRKLKKIYPFTIALSYPYYASLDKGKILETIVAMNMANYWREGAREVDFIKREELIPFEIKAKEDVKREDLASLLYFMKKYKVRQGNVIYEGKNKTESFNSFKIKFINIISFLCDENVRSDR
jgi:predicted AAA+ superfamily ATPase